jgi:hypothetical protein
MRPNRAGRGVVEAAFLLIPIMLSPIPLQGQGVVGALSGHIADEGGRPVAGAALAVPALGISVRSDVRGTYILQDLPVGMLRVRVEVPGGPTLDVPEVRIHADLTSRLDFRLEAGGSRVVAIPGRAELLDPTSRATLTGEVLRGLPVDDIRSALRTEVGVVETDAGGGPIVRGGGSGEAPVFLDDVPFRIASGRAFAFGPGTNAVEEATVFEGPLASPLGNAQSGVINLVTRSGGSGWRGGLTAATDAMFGSGTNIGLNRFQAFADGSPFGSLSVFAAATLQGENAVPRGAGTAEVQAFLPGGVDTTVLDVRPEGTQEVTIPKFIQYSGDCASAENFDTACHGRQFPDDWRTALTMSGRAEWRYGAGSRLGLTAFHDLSQGQTWPGAFTFDREAYTGTRRTGTALVLNWEQRVRASVTVHAALSGQVDQLTSGVLDVGWSSTHRSPAGGIVLDPMRFLVDFDHFSIDTGAAAVTRLASDADWERLVTNVMTNTGTRVPYWNRTDLTVGQAYRMNPWAAASGLPTRGLETGYPVTTLTDRRYWIARGYADWQPSSHHRVRGGAELETSRVNFFKGLLISQIGGTLYSEAPRQAALFADYRLTYGSVVLDAGLRWDRFDPNTSFPVVPGRIFTHPKFDPADPLDPADSVFAPASARSIISPRLRVAYAGLPGLGVRLGIARQAQPPAASILYGGKNRDLAFSSTFDGFSTDLESPRSWLMELGVRGAMGLGLLLDVAGYIKTRDDEVGYRIRQYYDPTTLFNMNVLVAANFDAETVKGIDVGLTGRAGAWLDARIGYGYLDADRPFDPESDRKHTVAGRIGLRGPTDGTSAGWLAWLVRGGEAWAQFRVGSGAPYTRLHNTGAGYITPVVVIGDAYDPVAIGTTPAIREFDLRISKQVRLGQVRWTVFGDFRNLLGFTNTLQVFAETGDVTNDLHRALATSPERARLQNEAGGYWTTVTKNGATLGAADLRASCDTWPGGAVNCVLLRRAEARWGDGDGLYDELEQQTAFDALYNLFYGPWYFHGAPRHMRLGVEVRF